MINYINTLNRLNYIITNLKKVYNYEIQDIDIELYLLLDNSFRNLIIDTVYKYIELPDLYRKIICIFSLKSYSNIEEFVRNILDFIERSDPNYQHLMSNLITDFINKESKEFYVRQTKEEIESWINNLMED